MKRVIASLVVAAASSAFVFPVFFQKAVEGAKDSGYVYNVSTPGADRAPSAAQQAKAGFVKVLADYERLY